MGSSNFGVDRGLVCRLRPKCMILMEMAIWISRDPILSCILGWYRYRLTGNEMPEA